MPLVFQIIRPLYTIMCVTILTSPKIGLSLGPKSCPRFEIQLNCVPGAAGGAQVEEHAAGAAPSRVAAASAAAFERRQEVVVDEGAVVVAVAVP